MAQLPHEWHAHKPASDLQAYLAMSTSLMLQARGGLDDFVRRSTNATGFPLALMMRVGG
jgi:hypothetical protein